jgi:hypothetical protein
MTAKTEEQVPLPEERVPFATVAVKVFVLFLPSIIATAVFGPHARLATGIGLLLGAPLAWYCIPPRGSTKKFFLLLATGVVLCVVRFLIP